ncbi:MAG: extracellular solute-binding protein [Eubacteriales bacterium]|nr:extracellular solute-binding protein [Eubacteriales bacterium]
MKFTKKMLAPVLAAAMAVSSTVCVSAADETIKLTLWGAEEDQDLLKELVGKFEETYSDQTFDIEIGVESESTAKDTILTDVEAAADVFAFASDQIYDLVNAGALANLDEYDEAFQAVSGKSVADVKAANSESSVEAATVNDNFYAFPMAGDNSYFLYYDSSVVSPEDAQSWDSLLAAAEAGGKKVGMILASGWYNAGFFYGAGLTTDLNEDGTTVMDWNGTSPSGISGVDVVKSMLNIASNPAFQAVADGDLSNQIASGNLCAFVSGTWDADTTQEAFGDGYAATKLPTFTVGDQQVQMGSAFGYKFIGVNAYAENIGWAAVLAEFLTNEEAQITRFDQRQIGPTNLKAVETDAVQDNLAIAAVIEQSEFGVIQKVGGKYWDPAQTFGENIAQGKIPADDDGAIQEALDTLVEGVTAPVE